MHVDLAAFKRPCTPRDAMPQVGEGDLLALLVHLARHGVETETCRMPVDQLVFHQRVYEDRIPARRSADMNKPLLVASDGYILDGNHRAAAHRRYGTTPVVFQLDCPFIEAIKAIFTFPRTYTYGESK